MNLTECFLKDNLFIDFGAEIRYGSDQVNVSSPVRFATVGFQLMATQGLEQIADRIRKEAGFRPMHAMDEYNEQDCDQEAWYDFFTGINDWSDSHMDSCIEFTVVNSSSPDNEETYTIDLDGDEQEYVYARLDEQCRKYLGRSCDELLAEAGAEIHELDSLEEDES